MNNQKFSYEYIQLLQDRFEYFEDKKIVDLTNDEINEFLSLKHEVLEVFPVIKETVLKVWESIKPYAEASELYQSRVLNKNKQ